MELSAWLRRMDAGIDVYGVKDMSMLAIQDSKEPQGPQLSVGFDL